MSRSSTATTVRQSPHERWRNSASLPLLLAALVFLAALVVTRAVIGNTEHAARAEQQATFNYRVRDLSSAIVQRMAVYEEMLHATRGFMRGSVDVSRADFATYYATLRLNQRFPGIEALGVATLLAPDALERHVAAVRAEGYPAYTLKPGGRRDVVTSITHIQPLGERNLRAFGYDMYSEPARRAALDAARDSGLAAATGKVTLVQEGPDQAPPSGFLMYVPIYRAGAAHATIEQRRAAIIGWAFAPFRMEDLMRGVGGEHAADLDVEIFDGLAATEAALLYRSPGMRAGDRGALFSSQSAIDMAGRPWTLRIRSAPAFEGTLNRRATGLMTITGIGLGLLLALVVWLLATERRRALQLAGRMTLELREAFERERQRQHRLDEARTALQRSQKLEAVGKLTGGVAHDFNNILHIISANTQLMLRADENSRKRLLGIMDAVERGRKLAGQLLAFARRQPLHPSVVNLAQLIERMDSLLQRAAGDQVRIGFAMPPGLWNTLVDPNQLENVLLNLVINARDAMDGEGRVDITLANVDVDADSALADTGIEPGAWVTVAVADSGSGMPADVMERAFEPFFTTKPEGKGTGLGLSMAHGFVKQSGGHIRLDSVAGQGTTVTIWLPRALQDVPDAAFAPVPH
jgi:signal transduction histidine kinase